MMKFECRESKYPIEKQILSRVSSRAFSDEVLSDEELMTLFEAARWAPSSYNNQPWRFLYARKDDPEWTLFFDALVDFNKSWCARADTLVVVISKETFDHNGKISRTASFDTGAAWMSLALEAAYKGIVAHAMEGFDHDKITKSLKIPSGFSVEAMIAIGKKGNSEDLSSELQEQEKISLRKSLSDIVQQGIFSF